MNTKFNSNIDTIITGILASIPHEIIDAAQNLGYELYAVGGCVRDPLLGRDVGDIDLAVVGDAPVLAREVARTFNSGEVAIYARFGTALVKDNHRAYEFATARKESYDPESRKPSEVTAVPIEEDLQRRDFTVNALTVGITGSRAGELIDLFNGLNDLTEKIIRTPLEPERTFSDDPLRMLRGIRFAAELGFTIDELTWNGIKANVNRLQIVAKERIGDELWKMLAGSDPVRAMELLIDSGLMALIMPEVLTMAGVEQIGRHHHKDVLKHSLKVMQNVVDTSTDPVVRLSGLLHDVGKPRTKRFDEQVGWTFHGHEIVGARIADKIGRRLKFGKDSVTKLVQLVQLHMRPVNLTDEGVSDSAIRRLMYEARDILDEQLILCRADITTANPKLVKRYLANFEDMESRMADVTARDKMRQFQSPIRGEEIMRICKLEPSPVVGALKGRIEDAILDGIIPYEEEAALDYLLKIKDEVLAEDKKRLMEESRNRSVKRKSVSKEFEFPKEWS